MISPTPVVGPSGVVNTRSDYYTIPPVDELDSMATPNTCDPVMVENFTVGRHDYGIIFFPGETNVRDLNLDELGKITRTFYPYLGRLSSNHVTCTMYGVLIEQCMK